MAVILNTSFPGANVNPLSSPFTTTTARGAMQQISNQALAATNGSACSCGDSVNTYPNDHYVVVTSATWTAAATLAALVRWTGASTAFISWTMTQGATSSNLAWRTNSTTNGTIATFNLSVAAAAGDIFELDAQGQLYTSFHTPISTGVRYQVSANTDGGTHLTSGAIGFGTTTFTAVGNATISNIIAGNFISSGSLLLQQTNQGGF